VFFLMHKWFIDSDELASMLMSLFEKEANSELNHDTEYTNRHESVPNTTTKIYHAVQ
jgi:hypothetical protein